jgi:hypothetical protein
MGRNGKRLGIAALIATSWLAIGGVLLLAWWLVLQGGTTLALLGSGALAAAVGTGVFARKVLGPPHA